MKRRLLTSGLLILAACACAGQPRETAAETAAYAQPAAGQGQLAAKRVSRSVWGVVPSEPGSAAQVSPTLISGSAVAVSTTALLTACKAVGTAPRVGIVHRGKYAIARAAAADKEGRVCVLNVERPSLDPVGGARSLDGLRPEEPVFGIVNQSNDELLVVGVDLGPAGLPGVGLPDLDLEATASLGTPEGTLLSNTVLVDAQGNLLGLGDLGPSADGLPFAATIAAAAVAPDLLDGRLGRGGPRLTVDAATGAAGLDPALAVDVNGSGHRRLGVDADARLAGQGPSVAVDVDGRPGGTRDPLTVNTDVNAVGIEQDLTVSADARATREDAELDIIAVAVNGRGLVEVDDSAQVGFDDGGRSVAGAPSGNGPTPGSPTTTRSGPELVDQATGALGGLGLGIDSAGDRSDGGSERSGGSASGERSGDGGGLGDSLGGLGDGGLSR